MLYQRGAVVFTDKSVETKKNLDPQEIPLTGLRRYLVTQSELLPKFLRESSSYPARQLSKQDTLKPIRAHFSDALGVLDRSAQALLTIHRMAEGIKRAGTRHSERDMAMAVDALHLTAGSIDARMKGAARGNEPHENERFFKVVYDGANPQGVAWPKWFWSGYYFISLTSRITDLPDPEFYLERSKTAATAYAPLKAELAPILKQKADADAVLAKAEAEVQSAAPTERRAKEAGVDHAQKQVDRFQCAIIDVQKKMFDIGNRIKDIDPTQLPECLERAQVSAAMNPEFIAALWTTTKSYAKLIAAAVDPEVARIQPVNEIEIAETLLEGSAGGGHQGKIAKYRFTMDTFQEQLKDKEFIATLLEKYCELRQAVAVAASSLPDRFPGMPDIQNLKNEMMNDLTRLLPFDAKGNEKVLHGLLSMEHPRMQDALDSSKTP